MATLQNKVRAITRSTTGLTSPAQVVEFIKDGVGLVISHIPKELLKPYATDGSFSTSTGLSYANNVVLGARRGNYESQEVNNSEAAWLESGSGSYMVPTAEFPKHYLRAGNVFVKPNPTTAALGYVEYIATPAITTGTSNVFGNLEHIVVYEAVSADYQALAGYFSASTSVTESMAYWLDDEDSEMVGTAANLVQHFNAKSTEYHQKAIQGCEIYIKNSSEMIAQQGDK